MIHVCLQLQCIVLFVLFCFITNTTVIIYDVLYWLTSNVHHVQKTFRSYFVEIENISLPVYLIHFLLILCLLNNGSTCWMFHNIVSFTWIHFNVFLFFFCRSNNWCQKFLLEFFPSPKWNFSLTLCLSFGLIKKSMMCEKLYQISSYFIENI